MTGKRAALIGLDWGTTSFRAYRIDAVGRVLEQRSRDAGILKVQRGDFAGTLSDAIGDWLTAAPGLPVLAAGMIGSRQGWLEAPYATCPAGLPELAAGLVTVEAAGRRLVRLVPGVIRTAGPDGFPDVMRGEETQIFGDLADCGSTEPRRYVLPGTHSKWAQCERGQIVAFRHLHDRRGLRCPGASQHPGPAHGTRCNQRRRPSRRGLARAARSAGAAPGDLLHDLFSARTLGLTSETLAHGASELPQRPADRRRGLGPLPERPWAR